MLAATAEGREQQGLPGRHEKSTSLHKADIHHMYTLPIRGLWPESNYFGCRTPCPRLFIATGRKGLLSLFCFKGELQGTGQHGGRCGEAGATHRVILQFLVVHVNDVGTDAIQKVLGVGDEDQDALKTAKPENQSGGRSER